VEEHRVLVDVLQEVLPRGALVGVELDLPSSPYRLSIALRAW
jgi:hypothetical protein